MSDETVVDGVFDTLEERTENRRALSVREFLDTFGRRAHGPGIFVIGVIALTPLGAIPGASIAFATLVILLAAQYAFRDGAPWIPRFLGDREADAERTRRALERVKPYARRAATVFDRRLDHLTRAPWTFVWALALIILALTMYPLALVPGGVLAPAAALAVIGLAITVGDGVVLAGACAFGAVLAMGAVTAAM